MSKPTDFLVAKDRSRSLYQRDDESYYFWENDTVKDVSFVEANEWLETAFATVNIDVDDSDYDHLVMMANECNMSLDCLITELVEQMMCTIPAQDEQ